MNAITVYRVYFQPGESFNDFPTAAQAQEYVDSNPGSTGPEAITVQLDISPEYILQ